MLLNKDQAGRKGVEFVVKVFIFTIGLMQDLSKEDLAEVGQLVKRRLSDHTRAHGFVEKVGQVAQQDTDNRAGKHGQRGKKVIKTKKNTN